MTHPFCFPLSGVASALPSKTPYVMEIGIGPAGAVADGPEELLAGFLEAAVLGMLELDGLLDMGCLHGNITPMAIQSISEVGL
ncbi:MAG: hypothetical protein J3T61_04025 [Candidatus Brocadiales bacterium]|nr:hypothetical protein [Candidatus Bathyanammoxibius sp.]